MNGAGGGRALSAVVKKIDLSDGLKKQEIQELYIRLQLKDRDSY